jgi:hypothetical protein
MQNVLNSNLFDDSIADVTPQSSSSQSKSKKLVVLLDLDDTLVSSTWVSKKISCRSGKRPTQAECRLIESQEQHSIHFLRQIINIDAIPVIITNANTRWIDYIFGIYPVLREFIQSHEINIFSARELYESRFTMSYEWKIRTFVNVIGSMDNIGYVMSVGDGLDERRALYEMVFGASDMTLASVKFLHKPDISQLQAQLCSFSDIFTDMFKQMTRRKEKSAPPLHPIDHAAYEISHINSCNESSGGCFDSSHSNAGEGVGTGVNTNSNIHHIGFMAIEGCYHNHPDVMDAISPDYWSHHDEYVLENVRNVAEEEDFTLSMWSHDEDNGHINGHGIESDNANFVVGSPSYAYGLGGRVGMHDVDSVTSDSASEDECDDANDDDTTDDSTGTNPDDTTTEDAATIMQRFYNRINESLYGRSGAHDDQIGFDKNVIYDNCSKESYDVDVDVDVNVEDTGDGDIYYDEIEDVDEDNHIFVPPDLDNLVSSITPNPSRKRVVDQLR